MIKTLQAISFVYVFGFKDFGRLSSGKYYNEINHLKE